MCKQQLLKPELLQIKASNGGYYMGGSQLWFRDSWKRMSGCGPTAASGMLWYLSRSRKNTALCYIGQAGKTEFLNLMHAVFDYVTPVLTGVSSTGIFTNGVVRYGNSRGVRLQTRMMGIPPVLCKRPSCDTLRDFILESLQLDSPLAFLNLSNGSLNNKLDSWHWVIIAAIEPDSMTATICDNGGAREIGLGEWLKTTVLGGGLVSIYL